MPEAPEVATIEKNINKLYLGNTLTSYVFLKGKHYNKDPSLFKKFKQSLPIKLIEVTRKGKILILHFKSDDDEGNEWWVCNSFGLDGSYRKDNNKSLVSNYDLKKKQKFARLEFKDEEMLFFYDNAGFGTFFYFFNNIDKFTNYLNTFSIDVYDKDFTFTKFKENWDIVSNKNLTRKEICAILIKQNYLCSGIGNYLKSEILYDAKINPHKTIDKFSDKEIKDLYNSIIKICNLMLKNEGRDLKTLQVYERKKDKNGYDVKYEKTPDRKYTYWVPEVQK